MHALHASDLNNSSIAAGCQCPCCRAAQPKLFMYGVVVVAVRAKKLRQRLASRRE